MTETELREQIHCSKDPKQCECGGSGVSGTCSTCEGRGYFLEPSPAEVPVDEKIENMQATIDWLKEKAVIR